MRTKLINSPASIMDRDSYQEALDFFYDSYISFFPNTLVGI